MLAKDLIAQLPIIDENIVAEAARMPQFFVDFARYRVSKMRKRSQALAKFEYEKAAMALRIRAKKDDQDRKPTEGEIKERVVCNKLIRGLDRKLQEAYAQEELSKLLLEACRERKSAIQIIHEAQLYEGGREAAGVEREAARTKLKNKARRLEEMRRRVEHE